MAFYPDGISVPTRLITDEFLLRPLLTSDVELDYAALMVSNEMLRRWGGSTWPADDFTPAENLIDLARHEQEHIEGLAYTYTVMNPSQEKCLGCVYVDPLTRLLKRGVDIDSETLSKIGDHEAVARFWVIQTRLADDLDWHLLETLMHWFKNDWAFSHVYFRANERDERQMELLQKTGLLCRYVVGVPGINGRYLVYG